MITEARPIQSPAELADAVGAMFAGLIVLLVLVVGYVSLIRRVHRDDAVDSFREDFLYWSKAAGRKAKWVGMTMRSYRR